MADSSTSSNGAVNRDAAEYIPLYRAIVKGDWEKAHKIFSTDKDALTAVMDGGDDRPIHTAVEIHENTQFLHNLINMINPPESLLTMVTTAREQTPLHRAAVVGNTKAAKMLVKKNPHLLFKGDKDKTLPIHKACFNSHKTTLLYLLDGCKQHIGLSQQDQYHNPFEGRLGVYLLNNVIQNGFLDVAYELVKDYPHLARTKIGDVTPLKLISTKWDAYLSGTRYNFYQRFVYSHVPTENDELHDHRYNMQDIENHETYNGKCVTKCKRSHFYSVIQRIWLRFWEVTVLHVSHIKQLQQDKMRHTKALMLLKCICEEVGKLNTATQMYGHYKLAYHEAVKNDTVEAIRVIMNYFPRAIWTMRNSYHLSQVAIINRCENVYNFMVHEVTLGVHTLRIAKDENDNNLLHLAGQLAPMHKLNKVSGAALQMQRELQWFKAVEKFMRPKDIEAENKAQETPFMMFRREHKELRKDGEEWMKKTADSYTITAALIITIVFAAAITVPGGTNGDTGKAIYATRPSFIIFAISDAISLFTSTTSLLLFLSILTARYAEEDFLYKLPKRLILGLAMLFLSVTSMMVAFSATLYLMFGHGRAWIVFPIATLACLPIASFVTLQLPLLVELISSTYGHGLFGKQGDQKNKQS